MPDEQQRPDGSFPVVVPAPCFSVWLARGAKVWPERLVIMVEEFCQLFCRILLGSTSDTNLSRTACIQTVLTKFCIFETKREFFNTHSLLTSMETDDRRCSHPTCTELCRLSGIEDKDGAHSRVT
jgi:hypothetical protein